MSGSQPRSQQRISQPSSGVVDAGGGSVRMIDTCSYPLVYKTNGGGPYLLDKQGWSATHLLFATSMLNDRFGGR